MRATRLVILAALAATPVVGLACGDSSDDLTKPASDDAGHDAANADASTIEDAPSGNTPDSGKDGADAITRGPASLDFDPTGNGDPVSLLWNDAKRVLYVADNRENRIWSWTDADGFAPLVKVQADPIADDAGRTNLGQIVQLPDGTLVVPRFGFGQVSALLYVDPVTGDAGAVPGIIAIRKRTALAVGDGGALWGGSFVNPGDGLGVVTRDTLSGETAYASGFEKPVGVLVQGDSLLVSDQTKGKIYALPLDGGFTQGGPYEEFATVPSCDALAAGPAGSVITGQFRPLADGGPLQLRQIFPDGGVAILHAEAAFAKPQGVAYDPTNKRLFVADSNGTSIRTIKILPLD